MGCQRQEPLFGKGGTSTSSGFRLVPSRNSFSGYTPVANIAVGAYVQGTGAPQWVAIAISNTYAFFKSLNGATAQQGQFRNLEAVRDFVPS